MLSRIRRMAEAARARTEEDQQRQQVIGPERFDDPLAARTEWVPAVEGGTNFCTRVLVQVSPRRVEFRPTTAARVVPIVFVLVGLAALAFAVWALLNERGYFVGTMISLAVGCLFVVGGATVCCLATRRIAFDQGAGCFWKGGSTPISPAGIQSRTSAAPLAEIHAVQLLSEFIEGSRSSSHDAGSTSSYHSYEINLVLKDGSRINVVDHGDLARIRQDAGQLARFLDVPIWDVTSART